MPQFKSRGLVIYTNSFHASELIVMCHGGWTEGKNTVKVPAGTSVVFYTAHWTTGSGGNVANALAGHQGASPYKPKVNSIAGSGSVIWNYGLTWDGPGGMRAPEQQLIDDYAHGLGSPLRDLCTPELGKSPDMKDVFQAIAKVKGSYDIVHYCPCRCVSSKEGDDVYDPILAAKMNSMKFISSAE